MMTKMKKKLIERVKVTVCKLFWSLFVLESLVIVYHIAPKPADPIITISQDIVSLSGPNIIKEGEKSTVYRITLNKDLKQDLELKLSYSGSALKNIDFKAPDSISIKEDALFAEFVIESIDDALKEDNEMFAVKIKSINGPSFMQEYNISDAPGVIYTRILDEKNPKYSDADTQNIKISGKTELYEDNKNYTYTLTLSQKAIEDIDVALEFSGSATLDEDFSAPSALLIKKGMRSAVFKLKTIDDIYKEGNESIQIKIVGLDDIGFEDIRFEESVLNLTLLDELKPIKDFKIKLSASKKVFENEKVVYTLEASEPLYSDVVFNFSIEAKDMGMYEKTLSTTMKKGSQKHTFELPLINDNILEKSQSIALKLESINSGDYESVRLNKNRHTTKILDEKTPTLNQAARLSWEKLRSNEIQEDSKSFTVQIQSDQVLKKDLALWLNYSGLARYGADYRAPKKVVMKKGSKARSFKLQILNDNIIEKPESIIIKVQKIRGGGLEKIIYDETLNLNIVDEPNSNAQKAILSLKGPKSVSESKKTNSYLLTTSQVLKEDLDVELSYTNSSALINEEFIPVDKITLKKGTKRGSFRIQTLNDDVLEKLENISVKIKSFSGGGLENIGLNSAKSEVITQITDETDIANAFKKIISNKKVIFEIGSFDITDDSRSALDDIAALLKKFPHAHLDIEGHTNTVGDAKKNIFLSQERAQSVKNYLITQGVQANSMTAIGHGESRPLLDPSAPNAKEVNKRVEFNVRY